MRHLRSAPAASASAAMRLSRLLVEQRAVTIIRQALEQRCGLSKIRLGVRRGQRDRLPVIAFFEQRLRVAVARKFAKTPCGQR